MSRWPVIRAAVVLLLVGPSPLAGPAWAIELDPVASARVDAGLRHVLKAEPDGPALSDSPIFAGALAPTGESLIEVVFELVDPEADAPVIEGMETGSRIGAIGTARLPLRLVPQLARAPSIVRLELSTLLRPSLDEAVLAARVDQVWAAGYTGGNVLVGVIDTGIDYRHDDFRLPGGNTRIKYLFDRSAGVSGTEYSEAQINAAISSGSGVPEVDGDGHGTHVSAIAAGNGRASGGTYAGVARGANILFYKAWNGSGLPTSWVIDALSWMQTKAGQLGRPLVVNMSFGNHFGAHDGSALLEAAVDELSGVHPTLGLGRVVVVAAGNDGDRPMHFTGTGGFSSTTTIAHTATAAPTLYDYVWYEIWYSGADAVNVRIQGPNGFDRTFNHGTVTLAGGPSTGSVYVDNASAGASPGNGDKQLLVILGTTGSLPTGAYAPADGDWTFTFSGQISAPIHGWIASAYPASARIQDADYTHLVAIPACAQEAIAVAAYVGRTCWPHYPAGSYCSWDIWGGSWGAVRLDQAAPFTSPGPTRDGRLKPEIAAPGMVIMAALSQDAPLPWQGYIAPDGRHQILQGTSMAAPVTAGAVALLLEQTPDASPAEISAALTSGASGAGRRAGPGILTVFDEDFDGSTAGWSVADGGSVTGDSWSFGTSYALSPGTAALVSPGSQLQNETLISPYIVLPPGLTLTLDFWHGVELPLAANGNHTVGIRPAGTGDAFTPLHTYTRFEIDDFPDGGWLQEVGIDLSAWAGQAVQIAWTYEGTNADAWFLDDVRVTAPTGGESWTPWSGYGKLDAFASLDAMTPIDILSFTALYTGSGVRVSWRVTDMSIGLGFVLARAASSDGPFMPLHDGLLAPDGPMPFVDRGVSPGRTYWYRLTERTTHGTATYGPIVVSTHGPGGGAGDRLSNAPNPFHPLTTIRFVTDVPEMVTLAVYDPSGRRVRTLIDGRLDAGVHTTNWDGRDGSGRSLASGVYFYRLRTATVDLTRRMAMVR